MPYSLQSDAQFNHSLHVCNTWDESQGSWDMMFGVSGVPNSVFAKTPI